MDPARGKPDIDGIAAEAVATLGSGRQITPFSTRNATFDLDDAYRASNAARALRSCSSGVRPSRSERAAERAPSLT